MAGKPILCLDFDGVIHSYTSGWLGPTVIPDPPVDGAVAFLRAALDVFDVQVHSSRSHHPGGIVAMKDWLCGHGGVELVEKLGWPAEKPPALVTLDDRALTFTGVWPTIETLRTFKPWNKRHG
jgi:hypothetical protein